MARKASAAQVATDIAPPDYRGAVSLLRTIKAKKDRVAGLNGEIGAVFDRVDNMKVDKVGARAFMKVDAMEPDERLRFFRAFNGLVEAARAIGSGDWAETGEDLVDKGQGTVVELHAGGRTAKPKDEAANEEKPKRGRAKSGLPGLEEARRHLGTAAPKDVDNSDLAGEDKIPGEDPLESPTRQ